MQNGCSHVTSAEVAAGIRSSAPGRALRIGADPDAPWAELDVLYGPAGSIEQLGSERKVARYVRGQPVRRFERKPGMNPAVHYDCIGCAAIATSGIGGANPCEPPFPCPPNADRPVLDAVRQHTLTRAIAVAFFDATLRGDAAADCFVRRRLAEEAPEVTVRSRGRFR